MVRLGAQSSHVEFLSKEEWTEAVEITVSTDSSESTESTLRLKPRKVSPPHTPSLSKDILVAAGGRGTVF